MMMARLGLVAGGTAMLLLLGGCEKKATGQVVAVVNGQEITQQELNGELNGAQLPAGAEKQQVMAQILQRVIDRKLLVAKAKADGLDQLPAYLDQVSRAQDAVLVQLLVQKMQKGQALPDPAAATSFIEKNPTLFANRTVYALDQISFPISNDTAFTKKLADVHSLDALETLLKASGVQYGKAKAALDTATVQPEMASRIASLPPGEPFVVTQNGQMIASVIVAAEQKPTPAAQSKPLATEFLRRQAVTQAMEKVVASERAAAKIEYQPGFAPPAAKAPAKP